MRHIVLLGLTFLAFPSALKAVRLEATHLAPEASVWFEPNHGQVGGRTEWTARAAGAWLFLTSNEVVYTLPPDVHFDPKKTRGVPTAKTTNVHMRIVGGRRVKGIGEKALGGYSNYFLGKHENEWFSGVPHFGQVRYSDVYRGIDVVFYTTGRNVEYDFIVKTGADPSSIELAFDGIERVEVDKAGDLVVSADGKSFRQHRPRVFQGSEEIEASYRMTERGTVKVDVGEFDPLVSLRVDPVLDFATYLGGPGEDSFYHVALSSDGNPVLVGGTQAPVSPTLDPFQQPSVVSMAPIVLKMSADGRRVLFYSILGRSGWDMGLGIALDSTDRAVVAGTTRSGNFPLRNEFQNEFRAIWDNGFVTRLSADGRTLIHSSYLGGSNLESLQGVTTDEQGNAYVAGTSHSNDFPLVQPLQPRFGGTFDAVLSKVGPDGRLLFSTYWGGAGGEYFQDIKWRRDGMIFAVGYSTYDGFPFVEPMFTIPTPRTGQYSPVLFALDAKASVVRVSTYLANGSAAAATALSIDNDGRLYVTGVLIDQRFLLNNALFGETVEGSVNGFLMSLRPDAKEVLWSTILPALPGGGVAVDLTGAIHVCGLARTGFPLKDSVHEFKGGGILNGDHGIMKITAGGTSLVYSTLLGGTGNDLESSLATGPVGTIYFVGKTSSRDYPVRMAYQSENGGSIDGVLARITDNTLTQAPPFRVSPSNFSLRYVQGDPAPTPLSVSVTNLTQRVGIQSDVDWLRISPMSLAANGNVQIQPELGRLAPGTYRGVVRIGPVNVDVVVTILAAAPLLSAVEPARIAIGTDETEITLRGTGFTNRTTVQLQTNPWQLTPLRFIDSTTLRLTLPKAYFSAEYNHSITVQNPDSAVSRPVSLAVGRPAPAIAAKGIVSAASYAGDVISPGEILTLFGENFEPGMLVNFDNLLATPLYITPNQLSVVAPPGIAGAREVNVIVEMNFDWRSIPVRIPVWPARPGLFTANSSGKGQAAALNQDGSVNSPANPAVKGSIAVLYGTGGGVENLPTKVFIDGIECEVHYAGQAPGLIAGAWQLNVRIPEFASKGEVVWRAGERESVEGVFVALKEN